MAGKDPLEYRRRLLEESPRAKAVVEMAAEKSDCGKLVASQGQRHADRARNAEQLRIG
jgi:hypothetical protein